MVKEAKNVDFYTSGRQPSEEDFLRISEWIKKDKQTASHVKIRRKNPPASLKQGYGQAIKPE